MPDTFLMACGQHFDVAAFLAGSPWREWADAVDTPPGFDLTLTDGGPLEDQLAEILAFLAEERDELQRLAAFPGVTKIELRFGFFWWRDSLGQFYTLPPDFLRQAGELGIAVTLCMYGADEKKPT